MIKNLVKKQEVMTQILRISGLIESYRKEQHQLKVNRISALRYIGEYLANAIDDRIEKLQTEIDNLVPQLMELYLKLDKLTTHIMIAEDQMAIQRHNNRINRRQNLFDSMVDMNERRIG